MLVKNSVLLNIDTALWNFTVSVFSELCFVGLLPQSSQTQVDIVALFPSSTNNPYFSSFTLVPCPLQQSGFTRDGSAEPLSGLIFNSLVTICMRSRGRQVWFYSWCAALSSRFVSDSSFLNYQVFLSLYRDSRRPGYPLIATATAAKKLHPCSLVATATD